MDRKFKGVTIIGLIKISQSFVSISRKVHVIQRMAPRIMLSCISTRV